MPSIIPGYEYDIFISYRQNDNKRDGWVTEFVETLKDELEATVKDKLNIYFDENPYDGLGDTHDVDDSLAKKLKCLIFIPIISKTYCDPDTYAWKNEFLAFNSLAQSDEYGLKVTLPNGNTSSRVLPIRIHDIDDSDRKLVENEIGFLRSIDFVYQSSGVNRPLTPKDERDLNVHKTIYRDQINKVANAIQETTAGIKAGEATEEADSGETDIQKPKKVKFKSELKRRNVLRASLVYILTALVLWKVTDISIGMFGLPDGTLNFVALLLIVLFPISILMAWLYERSPQGIIRTGSAPSRENPFTDAQKKPLTSNTFILLLVATVTALFLIYPQNNTQPVYDIEDIDKSIAVIPFTNMSDDPDQEYFSDGLSMELLNALVRIPGLKVIGRTSSWTYKGVTNKDVKVIGEELGVGAILEGSVSKAGTNIRIVAQLTNTEDGFNLWSHTYNRELTDIFAVQDEITAAIVNALKVHLSNETVSLKPTTTADINAYTIYLQARQRLASRGIENLIEARRLFEEAIALDPDYDPAYSGLGRAISLFPLFSTEFSAHEVVGPAKDAANKALELNTQNSEAFSVLGSIAAAHEWDWKAAEEAFNKSLELSPNDAEIYNFIGDYYFIVQHPTLVIEMESRALELDPLHAVNHHDLGYAYASLGDWENALRYAKSGQSLGSPRINLLLLMSYIKLGQLDEAENVVAGLDDSNDNYYYNLRIKTTMAIAKGESDKALSHIKLIVNEAENLNVSSEIARLYLDLGMLEDAAYWFEKAYENREFGLVVPFGTDRPILPENLPDHSALQAALDKPELNALFRIRRKNLGLKQDVQ